MFRFLYILSLSVVSMSSSLDSHGQVEDKNGTHTTYTAASCILAPEANIALISVNVNTMMKTKTPIKLGGYFVDDVQLTVIKQPNLPVRFVK